MHDSQNGKKEKEIFFSRGRRMWAPIGKTLLLFLSRTQHLAK